MTIFECVRPKAKFFNTRWYSEPKQVAKVVLMVREMDEALWASLPGPFLAQYKLMKQAGGPDKCHFDLEVPSQTVRFFSSGVSLTHAYAEVGTKVDEFAMKRQQAPGGKEDEVVLFFTVTVELHKASVAWQGDAFGNELLIEVEKTDDKQDALPFTLPLADGPRRTQ